MVFNGGAHTCFLNKASSYAHKNGPKKFDFVHQTIFHWEVYAGWA